MAFHHLLVLGCCLQTIVSGFSPITHRRISLFTPKGTRTRIFLSQQQVDDPEPTTVASPEGEEEPSQIFKDVLSEMKDTNVSNDRVFSMEQAEKADGDELMDRLMEESPLPPSSSGMEEEKKEQFFRQALSEALSEAESATPEELASVGSKLDSDELMKGIQQIVESGNEKLKESLEELREEQMQLAKENAERNASRQVASMEGDRVRMEKAQDAMAKLVDRVKTENAEMERAMKDLSAAQDQLANDPAMRLLNLKDQGYVKQGALVGALLFSVRALGDVLAMGFSADSDAHATAALVQGAIALVCAAYFFLF